MSSHRVLFAGFNGIYIIMEFIYVIIYSFTFNPTEGILKFLGNQSNKIFNSFKHINMIKKIV